MNGLQQIVERVDLERAQGILVVGRREDEERHALEALEQIEATAAGHGDVEEQHVDRQLREARLRLVGVRRLPDHR